MTPGRWQRCLDSFPPFYTQKCFIIRGNVKGNKHVIKKQKQKQNKKYLQYKNTNKDVIVEIEPNVYHREIADRKIYYKIGK